MAQPETFANDPVATLSVSLLVGDTTVTPNTYTNWPASGQFRLQCESEVMLVTDASTHPWPVTRGVEGAAAAHSSGLPLYLPLTNASLIQAINDRLAITTVLVNGSFTWWGVGFGPFTTNGAYGPDQWKLNVSGTDTLSVSRDTTHTDNSTACAALTYTHGNSTATDLEQPIENYKELLGRTISISIRLNTATASAVRTYLWDAITGFTYSAYHSGSGLYETITVTAPVNTGAGGLIFGIVFSGGVSCVVYADNGIGAVSIIPPTYQPLPTEQDRALCDRYRQLFDDPDNTQYLWIVGGNAGAISESAAAMLVLVPKAGSPTFSKGGTWAVVNSSQPAVNGTRTVMTVTISSAATGYYQAFANSTDDYVMAEFHP